MTLRKLAKYVTGAALVCMLSAVLFIPATTATPNPAPEITPFGLLIDLF